MTYHVNGFTDEKGYYFERPWSITINVGDIIVWKHGSKQGFKIIEETVTKVATDSFETMAPDGSITQYNNKQCGDFSYAKGWPLYANGILIMRIIRKH